MQINLNSAIYKTNIPQVGLRQNNITVTKPETNLNTPITFMGANVIQKTVTSQIAHEKSKLLRHLKDILALNVPILSEEEKISALIKKAHATVNMIMRREEAIEKEMEFLTQTNTLNAQQKMDRAQQLRKEFNRLRKTKLVEPEEKKPAKENYDYALINKFKTAVMNDDFDLAKIYEEHYQELANIQTVEELKEKYPSIKIPSNPKDVLIVKILDTLNRKFYTDLDELFEQGNEDNISCCLLSYFNQYFENFSEQFENKSKEDLLNLIGIELTKNVLAIYEDLKINEDFDIIPKTRMHIIAPASAADKEMLELDYDKLVVETFKKMILEGKKPNQIEYTDEKHTINISSIKSSEYHFEKIPEKIKRLIQDAQKPLRLQRDYQKFTSEELKARLNLYTGSEISNNDIIFDRILDFDSCKFTEEDKQYLIKFLQILDDINDEKISLEEGIEIINKNNIKPHGTNKINEIERKNLEEKIKSEQNKQLAFNNLRQEFNHYINKLYALNLSDIAESFSKYYPVNYSEEVIQETTNAIELIKKCLSQKDSAKIRTNFLRMEIYNDYASNLKDSEKFSDAQNYAQLFDEQEKENRIGQYLINSEIVENYPSSRNMFKKTKILDKIIEKFGYDKNLATIYLSKYENYMSLNKEEKQSILNILGIFDAKNSDDRILLKDIIENDYINVDTTLESMGNIYSTKATISSKAKKAILDKYKFPGCIDLFEAFENALTSYASEFGSSGIKKTGSNKNSLEHKMEVKIMGYPDRLFSSRNNYYFDIYSDRGLH